MFLGQWQIDDLLTFPANTFTPSTGAGVDADAVPAYRVYEDETGTAILTGNMAKLDDANTVGFYSEQITLSAANGFEVGKSYTIYISAAVGAVTGTTAHTFQVELAPLSPTTAGRTLDVSAGGEAGIDWANVGTPGSTVSLSATTVATVTTTGTASALGSGAITTGTFAAGAIDAAAIAADAIGSSELASSAVTEIQSGLATDANMITLVQSLARSDVTEDSDIGGTFDSATDSLQAIRDRLVTAQVTVVSPVATNGNVTIVQGDSYSNSDGLALSWSVTNPGSVDLTSGTVTMVISGAAGGVDFSKAATVTTASGATLAFRVEPTVAETATLSVGQFSYQIEAVLASARVVTLVEGVCTVTRDIA